MPSISPSISIDDVLLNENLKRVEFTQPSVDYIVSRHASSLLATAEPVVELSDELRERANQIFMENTEKLSESKTDLEEESKINEPFVSKSKLQKMIRECNLNPINFKDPSDENTFDNCIDNIATKHLRNDNLLLDDFIGFIKRFNAPAYYYGQRLRRASGRGDISLLTELLFRGCSVNTSDGEGLSSLHYACEFNKTEAIETIWKYTSDHLVVNAKCKYGWTPLYTSVHHGSIEAVHLLLSYGADVTIANNQGKTPLHEAAARNREELIEVLIEKGANIFTQDLDGMTAVHEAAFRGHQSIYDLLIKLADSSEISEVRDRLGNRPADYIETFLNSSHK